ncbi:hypothetical protein D9598_00950 [Roseomonas sp. KE0001]|nr:hypothetical protein [Roseomonas sp. KE0001]
MAAQDSPTAAARSDAARRGAETRARKKAEAAALAAAAPEAPPAPEPVPDMPAPQVVDGSAAE